MPSLTLSKFRHSCVLVELNGTRLLVDPGVFSSGFEPLTDLAAVLITHQHPDHLDVDRLRALLATNPGAQVIADPASSAQLAEAGVQAQEVRAGETVNVSGVALQVYGGEHAQIAPGIAVPPNVGYAIEDKFAYAGDAYTPPPQAVEVLAIPTAAPWLKAAETVAYLQQVRPKAVVPVHEALLAHTEVFYAHYRRFSEEQQTAFRVLDDGAPVTF